MADEKVWRFEFVEGRIDKQDSGIGGGEDSGINNKDSDKKSKNDMFDAFYNKVSGDAAKAAILTPLNSAVGRVSRPLYMAGRRIANGGKIGAAVGTAAGALAIIAIQETINTIQKRIDDIQQQVEKLNEADNVLIRSGAVSTATYYTGNFFGIKKKTDRS